jgi:threonylcarbamoyladenosine tRNA methylthiotransferase MtaB
MKAAFYTLGCKLNQCESEALASSFWSQGFFIATADESADIYIVNTCTVTSRAEQKARRMIRKFSREHAEALVIVTGCYAQLNKEELAVLGENVVVVSHENKDILLDLPLYMTQHSGEGRSHNSTIHYLEKARGLSASESSAIGGRFRFEASSFSYHSRAFLKIQDGCDNRCAYCRVPLARGNSVSLSTEEVLKRVETLSRKGYREVVLTGVNISSYLSEGRGLPALLRELPDSAKKMRIRLSSLEPEMVTEELAEAIADESICPHFHIPVQSGSDSVLKEMHRRYLSGKVEEAVARLRKIKNDPFIAADVIVGFPGEAEEDFLATEELLKNLAFSRFHVFPYSPRPGTSAWGAKNPVAERIRDNRARQLRELSGELHQAYRERWEGKEVEVILERRKKGIWSGVSENYLHLQVSNVPPGLPGGSLCRVAIIRSGEELAGDFRENIF